MHRVRRNILGLGGNRMAESGSRLGSKVSEDSSGMDKRLEITGGRKSHHELEYSVR